MANLSPARYSRGIIPPCFPARRDSFFCSQPCPQAQRDSCVMRSRPYRPLPSVTTSATTPTANSAGPIPTSTTAPGRSPKIAIGQSLPHPLPMALYGRGCGYRCPATLPARLRSASPKTSYTADFLAPGQFPSRSSSTDSEWRGEAAFRPTRSQCVPPRERWPELATRRISGTWEVFK